MTDIPEMASEEWAALSRLLDEALERQGAERDAWMAQLTVTDPAMAERLARALAVYHEEQFASFLAEPLIVASELLPPATFVGRRVGPYQIDAQIGQGGMGSVWRAHRADGRYEGFVAVKFLHASWMGQAAEARFRIEGNLLSRLSHPNIARLLDAGVLDASQPYIVLEYVEGDPIDIHCERRNLGLEARSRLFLDVIAAVAHAHAQLVVHRDLKPSNILVTREGTVKLLDFGIAKLLDADAPTGAGATSQLMTPLYAAPEQLMGKPALTATDIYSLGLIYYRLLTGAHPLSEEGLSNPDLLTAMLTRDPRPASASAGIAQITGQSLQGDLDNILSKALKKEPLERYETAASFADDIRRYLSHQPVTARPDTLRYRTGKFVRRHRGSVLTAIVTAVALILTTAIAVWQTHSARRERDAALAADRVADSMGEFLTVFIGNLGNGLAPEVLRPKFDQARQLVEQQRYDDPLVKANLLRYLSGRYEEMDDQATAVTLLEEAQEAIGHGEDPVGYAQLDCSIANVDDDLGRSAEADLHIRRAIAVMSQRGSSIRPQVRADCRVVESYIATSRGENRRAVVAAQTALTEVEQAGVRSGLQHDTVINALARAEARGGSNAVAVKLLSQLHDSDVAQGRDQTIGGWIHSFNKTRDLLAGGRVDAAEQMAVELQTASDQFGRESDNFQDMAVLRGRILLALAHYTEAISMLTRAVENDNGPGARLDSRLALIEALFHTDPVAGRRELDKQDSRFSHAILHGVPEAPDVLRVRALARLIEGYPREADALLKDAAARARDADGLPTVSARPIAVMRAEISLANGGNVDACEFANAVVSLARNEAVDAQSSAFIGEGLLLRARCEAPIGRLEEARSDARTALVHLEANLGGDHPLSRRARELQKSGDSP